MNSPESKPSRLIAGAMSGTSADGVDVAITQIVGCGLEMSAQLVLHHHRGYDAELRKAIFQIRQDGTAALRDLSHITRQITLTYATAINEALIAAKLGASDLAAASAHGQTLFHDPPLTMQIFDPSLLAAEVGCAVVSDFRRADLAAGGQGAPLVPFADYILFRDAKIDRMLVNIGGIANVTCLFAGAAPEKIVAFDTGPGNCISDHLMRQQDPSSAGVDVDGKVALSGRVSQDVFDAVNADPYFKTLGTKSTDGPVMIEIFTRAAGDLPLADQLATASAVTAKQISRALSLFGGNFNGELIVSGGGIRNRAIMKHLSEFANNAPIRTPDDFGILSESKEALAFALLAAATLDGVPSNVPSATGAKRAVVLGSITPWP